MKELDFSTHSLFGEIAFRHCSNIVILVHKIVIVVKNYKRKNKMLRKLLIFMKNCGKIRYHISYVVDFFIFGGFKYEQD